MSRRAAKVDRNQSEIVAALRDAGASVQPLHTVGQGVPDLLVGHRGVNYLLEVKDGLLPPSERRLSDAQEKWHPAWRGAASVVTSIDDALRAIGVMSYTDLHRQILPGASECLGADTALPGHGEGAE
jgi:hypothetical protein